MRNLEDRESGMADMFFAAAHNPISAVVFFAVLWAAVRFGFFEWAAAIPEWIINSFH